MEQDRVQRPCFSSCRGVVTFDRMTDSDYYRKINNRHDLYEYKHHQTLQDTIEEWERDQIEKANGVRWWRSCSYNPTLEEAIQDWKTSYVRK